MLFRSLGFAGGEGFGGSGIGLMDIILIGVILYGIYWFIKRRRQQAATATSAYREMGPEAIQPGSYSNAPAYAQPEPGEDLNRGISHIRQMDPYFEEKKFQDACMDYFFKIQGAWMNRDLAGVRDLLAEEIYDTMKKDTDQMKAEKKINRLENIAVRSVDITEAWQEGGKDYITVKFYANLLDYTTDESGQVISGSKTEPVKFEEYWTFARPVGANPWQLSAITQAQ
jgi:predicted lipid-binding transport protein (Tim44 family)